ncbi:MAG: hypothetical protein R2705_01915 [Ilumatobacteraceae bacterium]
MGSDEVAEAFGDRWTTVDEARFQVVIGEDTRVAVIRRSFLGGGTGAVGLVLDSSGMYALAMEEYSAAGELRLGVTDRARLRAPRRRTRPARCTHRRPGHDPGSTRSASRPVG